jgi:hypothetical protein
MSLALKKSNLVTVNSRSVLVRLFLSGKGRGGEGRGGEERKLLEKDIVGVGRMSGPLDVTAATKLFFNGSQKPQGP